MLRKLTSLAAMLVLLTILAVPLVLAQQAQDPPFDSLDLTYVPTFRAVVDCPFPTQENPNDPADEGCPVDENGFVTAPDGTRYFVGDPDDAGFLQYRSTPSSPGGSQEVLPSPQRVLGTIMKGNPPAFEER